MNTMEYKGFKARIHQYDKAKEDAKGSFHSAIFIGTTMGHSDKDALNVYHSEQFIKYPKSWMRGPGVFVVGVVPGKALCFDWSMNDSLNTAVVASVKGVNPLTGLSASKSLESYEECCPKHGCKFEAELYCSECGYKWPAQNYLSHPNSLKLPGWRTPDGSVREFVVSEDMSRDVASHIIGKESAMPSFGFAFYKPKVDRERTKVVERIWEWWGGWNRYHGSGTYSIPCSTHVRGGYTLTSSDSVYSSQIIGTGSSAVYDAGETDRMLKASDDTHNSMTSGTVEQKVSAHASVSNTSAMHVSTPMKDVAIGAGKKLDFDLKHDDLEIDGWREEPSSTMVIQFCLQSELDKLLEKGLRDFDGNKEGMLAGFPVG